MTSSQCTTHRHQVFNRLYGVATWNTLLDGANQRNLRINQEGDPTITVEDLEVAQFLYMVLHNEKISRIFNSATGKIVLILGRFKPPSRKAVLDTLRDTLQSRDFVPIVFDFAQPHDRELSETVGTLAGLSRYILADITYPESVPAELQYIVPNFPSVPVKPLIEDGKIPYSLFKDLSRRSSGQVLPPLYYRDIPHLLEALDKEILVPLEAWIAARGG